jgi:Domain of unknown function (DUF4349)
MVVWVGLLVVGCGARQSLAPEMPGAPEAPAMAPAPAAQEQGPSPSVSMESAPSDELMASAPAGSGAVREDGKPDAPQAAPAQGKTGSEKNAPVGNEGTRPLLIYEAHVNMRVERGEIPKTIEQVIDLAEANGGYLISRNDQSVQIRVPSLALRQTLSKVESQGEVLRRSVTAQDVSEQYHDLGVRLRSLEAVRDRLQQFLGRATNVTEAMNIAKQLDAVGQQIDQVKGRMQFLRTRAAFSLLSVALEEKPEIVVVEPPPPPPPPTPPAPKAARLPVPWLNGVGLDTLTRLPEQN